MKKQVVKRKLTSKMYDSSDFTSARVCGSLEMATTSFNGYCKKDVIMVILQSKSSMKIFLMTITILRGGFKKFEEKCCQICNCLRKFTFSVHFVN